MLEIVGQITADMNESERIVFDILRENLNNKCNGILYPKYHLLYRNDRDCEIFLYIESNNRRPFKLENEFNSIAHNLMILIEVKGHEKFTLEQNNQLIVQYNEGKINALDQVNLSKKKLSEHIHTIIKKNPWIYYFVAFPKITVQNCEQKLISNYQNSHLNKNILLKEEINFGKILNKCFEQRSASLTTKNYFTSLVTDNHDKNFNNIKKYYPELKSRSL